ncbi:MAG: DsrE family protein [Thiobacillus sp.]
MTHALIILHAAPDAPDNRGYTAIRLAGAMLADSKDVHLFLVEEGARLADPGLPADNPCRELFYELLDVGLDVQVCGGTMRRLGWEDGYPLPGVRKSSMKGLSALISEADEIITF